jgi:uncharacterized membrane protein
MIQRLSPLAAVVALGLAACTPAQDGIDPSGETFDQVGADEVVTLVGTEPFWNVRIDQDSANYSNPNTPKASTSPLPALPETTGWGFREN